MTLRHRRDELALDGPRRPLLAEWGKLMKRFDLEDCGGTAMLWKKMKGWTAQNVEWPGCEFEGHRSGWKLAGQPDPEVLCK